MRGRRAGHPQRELVFTVLSARDGTMFLGRRIAFAALGVTPLLAQGTYGAEAPPEARSKPNIVYIMADDLGYGVAASPNRECRTAVP